MSKTPSPEEHPDNDPHFIMPDEPIFMISAIGDKISLRKRRSVELTYEYAASFLEINEFVGDRPLRNNHVVFLTRQMEGGTFRPEQVNLVICWCLGKQYRMNGQHTAWARLYADIPKTYRMPVQLLEYEAKTEQDMRQLYSTIDRGRARVPTDIIRSYLLGHKQFSDFGAKLLRILAQGLQMHLWSDKEKRSLHTSDETAYLMLNEHYKLVTSVGAFMQPVTRKNAPHVLRMAVVAAMFATFSKAPQISQDFWTPVLNGVGINIAADPRLTLRNYLMTVNVDSARPDKQPVGAEEMYRACVSAWNAYRQNTSLKVIRVHLESPRPEAK